jgi:hypothetical protein
MEDMVVSLCGCALTSLTWGRVGPERAQACCSVSSFASPRSCDLVLLCLSISCHGHSCMTEAASVDEWPLVVLLCLLSHVFNNGAGQDEILDSDADIRI